MRPEKQHRCQFERNSPNEGYLTGYISILKGKFHFWLTDITAIFDETIVGLIRVVRCVSSNFKIEFTFIV